MTDDYTLLVEDHRDTQVWLRRIVERAFPGTTVHIADSASDARLALQGKRFSRAIVDLELPDGDGVDIIDLITRAYPHTQTVVATVFNDEARIIAALSAGAGGYVLKDQGEEALVKVLQRLQANEPPLSPTVAQYILGLLRHQKEPTLSKTSSLPAEALTCREAEVLEIIARGASKKDVANSLGISEHTVSTHVKAIYRKLDISSRAEATTAAFRLGLIG